MRANPPNKKVAKLEWTWVPDEDGTPDQSTSELEFTTREKSSRSRLGTSAGENTRGIREGDEHGIEDNAGGNYDRGETGDVCTIEELARWKPDDLRELMHALGLDASGNFEELNVAQEIARCPGGLAAAAKAAAARGDVQEKQAKQLSLEGSGAVHRLSANIIPDHRSKGEDLRSMDIRALRVLMEIENIDAVGCHDTEDFILRIEAHRKHGSAAATSSQYSPRSKSKHDHNTPQRPDDNETFIGMSLEDYMNRSAPVTDTEMTSRRGGISDDRNDPSREVPRSTSRSAIVSRPGTSSGNTAHPNVVHTAPAHIAPPRTPAPDWVLEMQVCIRVHEHIRLAK